MELDGHIGIDMHRAIDEPEIDIHGAIAGWT